MENLPGLYAFDTLQALVNVKILLWETLKIWNFIQNKDCKSRNPNAKCSENRELTNPQEVVIWFADFFWGVYIESKNYTPQLACNIEPVDLLLFTENDILHLLKILKPKMTSEFDNVPTFILKGSAHILAKPIQIIYNLDLVANTFHTSWK